MFWKTNDKQFEEIFKEHIGLSAEAAQELVVMFSNFDQRSERIKTIDKLETRADEVVARTHELLDQSFITRLDKPDIAVLIDELDYIVDDMKSASNRLEIYGITKPLPPAKEFAATIKAMTQILLNCFGSVSTMPLAKAKEYKRSLKKLEAGADELLSRALADLFRDHDDWKTALAWKDVYERLAAVTNHCNNVGSILMSIARKESN